MAENRLIFLDTAKVLIIAVVVVFHGAMSYMEYAPEWWYVLDEERSLWATAFVIWADVFIMPVMFFISGYVGAASLARRSDFWQVKWKRVGAPWLFGSAVIAPYIAYMYVLSRPISMTFYEFYVQLFWGVFYQQAQYWYLGFLMALYGMLYLCARIYPAMLRPAHKPFALKWFFLPAAACAAAMAFMLTAYDDAAWIHPLYVLCFQPTRAPIYVVVFFTGAYAWRRRWFSQRFTEKLPAWLAAFIVLSLSYTAFRLGLFKFPETVRLPAAAAFHCLFCIVSVYTIVAVCQRWGNKGGRVMKKLARASYGVYYVHQIVVMHVVWFLRPWDAPLPVKYGSMAVLSLLICFMLSAGVLSRIPPFKETAAK